MESVTNQDILIGSKEIKEVLKSYLNKDVDDETLNKFIDCLVRDKTQWLSDNAKWFIKEEIS